MGSRLQDRDRAGVLGIGVPGAGAGSDVNWRHLPAPSRVAPLDDSKRLALTCQSGVLRSHCVDCLDRTNVAQFAWGLAALGCQLERLGVIDGDVIGPDSPLATALMSVYRSMGDVLAMQYGGSQAHRKAEMARDGGGVGGPSGAVARVVNRVARGGATIFVTHYHDLAASARAARPAQVATYRMAYAAVGGGTLDIDSELVMLYKLVEGLADESFGLHAAKAAGLPDAVLRLAQAKREALESS